MSFISGSTLADIVLVLVFLCYLFYWYITKNDDYWEKRGVPYTKNGLMKESFRGKKAMADMIDDLYRRFSDKRYFGFFQVNKPMLVVRDLDLVNKILIKDFTHFQDRGQPQNDKELLSKNLFNLKGQVWRAMRYKLTPTFTTGKLKSMSEQVSMCGANMIKKIEDLSAEDPDIDCKDFLFEFTTEVISSCAFGLQFEPNSKEFASFKAIVKTMFRPSLLRTLKFIVIILFPKLAEKLNFTVFISKNAGEYFFNLIKSSIRYRKENNIKRNDYLQMLMTLKDQEDNGQNMGLTATDISEDDAVITDQLKYTEHTYQSPTSNVKLFTDETVAANSVIFLVAGSESTSNTTAFTLFQLAQHPDVQLKLQQEVDSVLAVHGSWSYQALKEMTYLDQVIQETQRFYPLLPLLQRECTKTYKVPDSDLVIEKGVVVNIPVIGLQKDPQYYPDPEVFKPERFEGNNFKPNPHFMPFGDGPRICIAMRFAVMEMKTAVTRIVANYKVTLSPKTQLPLKLSARSFVPLPEHGIWLNVKLKMSTVFADIQVFQKNLKALDDKTGILSVNTLKFVMSDEQRDYFRGEDDFLDWLLQGVGGAKTDMKVKISITADRGVVKEVPAVDPLIADADDWRVKQAFFDTIDLDTTVGPSEDAITVQFACDLRSIEQKLDELSQQLNGKTKHHRNELLQARNKHESLKKSLIHLRKELVDSKKYPRSDLEKDNLLHERSLRNLQPDDRWRLYHTWVNILREGLIVTLGHKDAEYKEYSFRYEQLRQNDDLQILKTANVVGTTTTLAAKFQPMFAALAPRIVIVEEAAEVLEAHIVASLSKSCEHLILIGDHKQLRPSISENRMARQYQLDVSLFERMVLNGIACHTLTLQHRMRPEISKQLVPTIYPELRDDPSVMARENIRGMDKNVYFMTHRHFEDEVIEITSKRNHFEAEILLGLAKYLVQQGYKPQEITILATYKGQMYHMKNEIKNMTGFPKGIQITVVDNFQGEENKIILLSLVRSNAVNKIGYLEIENRICVALSRARDGFYIVGNMDCLVASSGIWAKIRSSLVQQQAFGPTLRLRCQIHKEKVTEIASASDFSKVSEGGCSLLCGQPLPCGHSCKSICHVEQDYHQRYKCKEPCSKILCAEGHQCEKKCHQQCGQCQIPIRRQLECSHFANIPCFKDPREHPCAEPVTTVVPFCRHTVTVPCHTRFYPVCNLPCTKRLECGHSCELQCHETEDPDHLDYACMKPCARLNKNCSMDHKCSMACFEDCQPCPEMVLRKLPCGHSLKLLCSADLSTVVCKQKCEKIMNCGHPCTKKCFQQCEPCMVTVEKKVPRCEHTMKIPCSVPATRQICEGPCSNSLGCGHKCAKKCKDICSSADCEEPVKIEEKFSLLSRFTSHLKLYPMLCGHSEAHVPCNKVKQVELMTPEELMQYCCEPCGKVLKCKHVCSGTCSQCMQGRIHKLCKEECGNVLICGHSCKVPCREVCPPCKEPCRHECEHSKCNRKCGEECVPCNEPCDYACSHLKCSRRCGELCDRDPCYEPCSKRLNCGHSCVGFCGEPCPPCRQCDPEHFEEIFYTDEETEEDSKWVKLTDCGHTLESTGLEMWLNMEQESGEIGCKVCPRCKTPIVKVQRFMNLIKQTYLDIQHIKAQCFGKPEEIKKERVQALRKIQNVQFTLLTTINGGPVDELEKLYNELKTELPDIKKKKRNTIDTQKLRLLCFWTEFFVSVYTRKQEVWSKLNEESKCLLNGKINFITRLLMKRQQKINEQEMQSFEREVKRIHRICDLLVFTSSMEFRMASYSSGAKKTSASAESLIFSIKEYDEELDSIAKLLLRQLKEQIKSSTEISNQERAMINQAMSSSFRSAQKTGHWFKCKNGHVYCITECGGAMQEARCPIRGCGEMIGGQQHRLREDQDLASEMDGARHAAWSDANNMANFGII